MLYVACPVVFLRLLGKPVAMSMSGVSAVSAVVMLKVVAANPMGILDVPCLQIDVR